MEISMTSFQKEGLLSVVQFVTAQKNCLEYLSLKEAISNNRIILKEKDEGADVNNLIVINRSNKPIFLMDGDILEGAKQNRVLNSSVLLAPNSEINLPVSCVEQGRWNVISEKFTSADYTAPSKMRSNKERTVRNNLNEEGFYFADQGRVWGDVSDYHSTNKVYSKSSNLSDMYKQYKGVIDKIVAKFKFNMGSNGFGVFVKNNLLCLDVFNRSDVTGEYFGKIIKGALFEVVNLKDVENKITQTEAEYKTRDVIDTIDELPYKEYKSVSLGKDIRYESDDIAASELHYKNMLVHLSAIKLK